ncbi:GTP-binding protein YPT6 [Tritrichomonas foetus]|uniref:GTP-binding protein YPT6 n=1 Tax=Tritrichomonas foetus TaxID=1144522 RepID=A0A1J4KRZ4_9EUKA|nr:GTP-binding protein YPT6 [Tritrichomonas foetus]|eukprot:OHT12438.1 GTP-binding protein YPT6 [Tritrichomonas foetus]
MTTHFKIILLGSKGSGKTSIINRHVYNAFNDEISTTNRNSYTMLRNQEENTSILLWDTPGSVNSSSITEHIDYNRPNVILIVYEANSKVSFKYACQYYKYIRLNTRFDHCFVHFVANKSDIITDSVKKQKYLKKIGFKTVFQFSAKTGEGFDLLKKKIEEDFSLKWHKSKISGKTNVHLLNIALAFSF